MKITLIITTYNWPEALFLVLKSIQEQSTLPDEIIIADDGSNKKTQEMISSFNYCSNLNIIHSWQKDIGFRASRCRNKAISKSSGDYIILIDGDVILHPKFIHDHIINAESGFFIQGCRSFLTKKISSSILINHNIHFSFLSSGVKNRKNIIYSSLLSRIFSTKYNNLKGIKSCNMSFYLKDFLSVNGFNNQFEGWGREDSEFIVRLLNKGVNRKNLRFCAIQFHLWHNESSRLSLEKNNDILINSINNNIQWCEDGINKLNKYEN